MRACACRFSHVGLFATLWTGTCQAPLSTGFSWYEDWSGVPCPPLGDLPNSGIKPRSPALQTDASPSEPPGKPLGDVLLLLSHSVVSDSLQSWTACQASLSIIKSWSLLKLMSTKSVISSNHLIRQRQKTGGNQKLTHIPQFWRRKRQPIPLFLPGKSHGQRSLVGYSLPGWKESDTTKQLSTHTMV